VRLRPDDVQDLFNSYDCTQSAAAGADDSLPVGEWLDSMGFGEYAEAFVSQVRRKRRFCDAIFILNTIILPSLGQTWGEQSKKRAAFSFRRYIGF